MSGRAYVVGTCDTKHEELCYVRDRIAAADVPTVLVDLGTRSRESRVDVTAREVASHHPRGAGAVLDVDDRGRAIAAMIEAFERFVAVRTDIGGMIGIGGGGGTALVAPGMRRLPVGTPKVMVSTLASGNVAPYVGESDMLLMHSVTDVAGLNRISRVVLANAAHALAGMMLRRPPAAASSAKPAIALTMFGVTTPCVERVKRALESRYDCLVFHATGTGGRTMEKLVDSELVVGAIDVTTTEVCDHLMGGVLSAGEDRFGAFARTRTPWVGSCGALDMVNFGALDTVPERYRGRNLYVHNPQVTLMRTTPEECARMGEWIAEKLNRCEGPVRLLIPEKGVSAIDAPGKPFWDPEADRALFQALERVFRPGPDKELRRLPLHVNDPQFADELVQAFLALMGEPRRS
jgi:uncharacterized protein (UPF0261 family)